MKDSGYARPEAVEIERRDAFGAVVWICADVVERTGGDGLVMYDYNRYGLETVWTEDLFERAAGNVGAWLDAARVVELAGLEKSARAERDNALSDTDHLMAADYPIDGTQRAAVAAYRQALRDLPEAQGWPEAVVWPEMPDINGKGDTILDMVGQVSLHEARINAIIGG